MDAWQRYLDLATGLTDVTRKGAEAVVRALVKQGEVAADRAERAVDELLQRSEANRKVVAALVRAETERAVGRLGLASQAEVDRLREEVAALRAQVRAGTAPPAKKSAAARRAGAVRGTSTVRRREAGAAGDDTPAAPAKKQTAKKQTAKKQTAKKQTAQKQSGAKGRARTPSGRTATAAAADAGETPSPTSGAAEDER